MYPEPSLRDHDASWNEGEEGECECSRCLHQRREMERVERLIDERREEEYGRGRTHRKVR